jgi:hypothetical protein
VRKHALTPKSRAKSIHGPSERTLRNSTTASFGVEFVPLGWLSLQPVGEFALAKGPL